jgi:hypothetical protein
MRRCPVSRFAAAAQTARTSASRLIAYSSSQQTAASHAADACAAMSCAPSSRSAALWGSTRSRSGDVDVRLVPVDQRHPIRGHADVARAGGVAVDDACLTSDEPRPRCSASSNALRRHRAEVDPRPGLGAQEVGRRSPTWALRPALRQPMQPAERGRPRDASRHPSRAVRPPRMSSPPDRPRTAGRPSSGSAPVRSDLRGRGVGGARSPTRDQRRSWHRDDRPRGARGGARSTRR